VFYWLDELQARNFNDALEAIKRLYPRHFAGDMMITLGKNMGFLENPAFMAAFQAEPRDAQETSLLWRLHVLCWCAEQALRLTGDFVECGVFRGFSSSVVARYLGFEKSGRQWYLYDTFSGIPPDQLDPGHANPAGYLDPALHESVVHRFAPYPNIRVFRGRILFFLVIGLPPRIAFLHLDLNSAKAELAALHELYDRIVAGGYILLDDYGWFAYRGQKALEDPFFRERKCSVLELPTGQGLVIKP